MTDYYKYLTKSSSIWKRIIMHDEEESSNILYNGNSFRRGGMASYFQKIYKHMIRYYWDSVYRRYVVKKGSNLWIWQCR